MWLIAMFGFYEERDGVGRAVPMKCVDDVWIVFVIRLISFVCSQHNLRSYF